MLGSGGMSSRNRWSQPWIRGGNQHRVTLRGKENSNTKRSFVNVQNQADVFLSRHLVSYTLCS